MVTQVLEKRQAPGGGGAATQTDLNTNPNGAQVTGTPTNSGHTVEVTAYTTIPADAAAASSKGGQVTLTGSSASQTAASVTGNNTDWTAGERAGLVIGIIAAACLFLIIIGYLIRHKRRRKEALSNGANYNVGGAWKKQKLQYKEADFEPMTQAANDNPFDWRNHRRMSSYSSAASNTGSTVPMVPAGPNGRSRYNSNSASLKGSAKEDALGPSIDERFASADYNHRPSARYSTDQIRANIGSAAVANSGRARLGDEEKGHDNTEMRQLLATQDKTSIQRQGKTTHRRNSLENSRDRSSQSVSTNDRPRTTGNQDSRSQDTFKVPSSRQFR